MGSADEFFPRWLERLMAIVAHNKSLLILAFGYAFCRCSSNLSFRTMGLGDVSMVADAGKVLGMVTLVVTAYVADRGHRKFWLLAAPGLTSLCGCVLSVVSGAIGSISFALPVGVFLFGFGTAAMMLQWLEFIGSASLKSIVLVIGAAEGLNSFAAIAIGADGLLSPVCIPMFILSSLALMLLYRRMVEKGEAPSLRGVRRNIVRSDGIVSLRLIVWVSAYCFLCGLVNSVMNFPKLSVSDNCGNVVSSAVIILAAMLLPKQFDIRILKNIAFLFMVFGLLVVGFLDGGNAWVQVFAGVGAASCRLFAYSLACMKAHVNEVSALPACLLVKALIIVMMGAGASVGSLVFCIDRTVVVAAAILLISLLSAFLSPFNIGERDILEKVARSASLSKREDVLVDLCAEKGLSKRESTVFLLMANGDDVAAISDELFISRSAVRAHLSRIYAKFNVHNRQEFEDVLTS